MATNIAFVKCCLSVNILSLIKRSMMLIAFSASRAILCKIPIVASTIIIGRTDFDSELSVHPTCLTGELPCSEIAYRAS